MNAKLSIHWGLVFGKGVAKNKKGRTEPWGMCGLSPQHPRRSISRQLSVRDSGVQLSGSTIHPWDGRSLFYRLDGGHPSRWHEAQSEKVGIAPIRVCLSLLHVNMYVGVLVLGNRPFSRILNPLWIRVGVNPGNEGVEEEKFFRKSSGERSLLQRTVYSIPDFGHIVNISNIKAIYSVKNGIFHYFNV